jgi:hypothetical protein
MSSSELLKRCQEAFREGNAATALALAETLMSHPTHDAPAQLMRGLIFEFGGDGVSVDLVRSLASYRAASILVRDEDVVPFLYMARVLRKQGPDYYPAAFNCVRQAAQVRHTPDVDIAYGWLHATSPVPNLDAAKKHFKAAALRGRFGGFFGYSSVLQQSGKRFQAALVDCLRILLGPLIFIAIGKKASSHFNV